MNTKRYIFRSLLHYRKSHFAIFAGCAVAVTVIVGALAVGDSVRTSLLGLVEKRLGNITEAMVSNRYFPKTELAAEIQRYITKSTGKNSLKTAPVLILNASSMRDGGRIKIPDVNIIGVDQRFTELYKNSQPKTPQAGISSEKVATHKTSRQIIPPGEALINRKFADKLGIKKGDTFILRISQPGILPDDISFIAESQSVISLRVKVNRIADASFPADFTLKTEQQTPLNVFLSLKWLGMKLKKAGRCNAIFAEFSQKHSTKTLNTALAASWHIEDIGLKISSTQNKNSILQSENIFIDEKVAKLALTIPQSEGVLTYFVNSITNLRTAKSTPYSFVSAVTNPPVPFYSSKKLSLPASESSPLPGITISRWLADDLNAEQGETIKLKYYCLGRMRQVVEKSAKFAVSAIRPTQFFADNPYFKLDLPGLTDSENCTDWNPGIPINLKKIRTKDEDYWDKYKGAPKALISLKKGEEIWANEFGTLTAVKFPNHSLPDFKSAFKRQCTPADFGLSFINIADKARMSAKKSIDFGELFLGLSFFIIFSALILTGMLFALSIESRSREIKILSHLGFKYCEIRKLIMLEHSLPALLGVFAGVPFGMIYNRVVIYLLNSLWNGAVGTSQLTASITLNSALAGALSGLFTALVIMWWTVDKKIKNLRSSQLAGSSTSTTSCKKVKKSAKFAKNNFNLISGIILLLAAATIVFSAWKSGGTIKPAIPFFAAGGLLLIAFWCFCRGVLMHRSRKSVSYYLAMGNRSLIGTCSLALKNCSSNIIRSMSAVMLLSSGLFIILAVAINLKTSQNLSKNSSGSGGYNLFVKTTLPILYDLQSPEGQKAYNLPADIFQDVQLLQMPLHGGSDASCLNLNRVESPAILGVNFAKLAKRKSFTFTSIAKGVNPANPWLLPTLSVQQKPSDHNIRAVADYNVIIWILGKNIGDCMEIKGDDGINYKIEFIGGIAPSVFQGYVLIPINKFRKIYPSSQGNRVVLVKCTENKVAAIQKALNAGLSELGVQAERCSNRVNRFLKVENTYLTIFLLLGGLGLIIGSVGFGIVVIRNITDRKDELTIMHAVGYKNRLIVQIITIEHIYLIMAGAFCGGTAAGIAAIPALISARAPIPWGTVSAIFAIILLLGTLSIYIAANYIVKRISRR